MAGDKKAAVILALGAGLAALLISRRSEAAWSELPVDYSGGAREPIEYEGFSFDELTDYQRPEPMTIEPTYEGFSFDELTDYAGDVLRPDTSTAAQDDAAIVIAPPLETWGSRSAMATPEQNTAAFLAMIRAAEGTGDEYRALFGYHPTRNPGHLLETFADHPRLRFEFTQTDGATNYTTAAGAYQAIVRTWDRIKNKLRLPDFSPASQDAMALELIREKGALADVRAGRFETAVTKIRAVWASLPGSPYPQHTRSWSFVQNAYAAAGGAIAADGGSAVV